MMHANYSMYSAVYGKTSISIRRRFHRSIYIYAVKRLRSVKVKRIFYDHNYTKVISLWECLNDSCHTTARLRIKFVVTPIRCSLSCHFKFVAIFITFKSLVLLERLHSMVNHEHLLHIEPFFAGSEAYYAKLLCMGIAAGLLAFFSHRKP